MHLFPWISLTRRDDHHNESSSSSSSSALSSTNRIFLAFLVSTGLLYFSINVYAYSKSLSVEHDLNQFNSLTGASSSSSSISPLSSPPPSPRRRPRRPHPELLPTDRIYRKARTSFVIPEYKLIFFTFPKVACSEWKLMFMRMNDNGHWCSMRPGFDIHEIHNPRRNGISTLADYTPEEVGAMMTSSKWTKATIVREPKQRVLSAFLDKAVNKNYYLKHCCRRIPDYDDKLLCEHNGKDFGSFLKFVTKYPKECFDVHWEPQALKIDSKWWPYIDFVGHQENLAEDAKTLLQSLTSTMDDVPGRTAWERYGATGWGGNEETKEMRMRYMDRCEDRPGAFLEENSSVHNWDTGSHLKEYYTPELEKLVRDKWAVEWEQEEAHFPETDLFADDDDIW